MLRTRLTKFILIVLGIQLVLAAPGLAWPGYFDSPIGLALSWPFLSVYLFHAVGIPGLLQNNGACGWGWCAPTALGWVAIATTWFVSVWVLAWVLSQVFPAKTHTEHQR